MHLHRHSTLLRSHLVLERSLMLLMLLLLLLLVLDVLLLSLMRLRMRTIAYLLMSVVVGVRSTGKRRTESIVPNRSNWSDSCSEFIRVRH